LVSSFNQSCLDLIRPLEVIRWEIARKITRKIVSKIESKMSRKIASEVVSVTLVAII
jgi:hypothetical protein